MVHAPLDAPDRWGCLLDKSRRCRASFPYQNTQMCFFATARFRCRHARYRRSMVIANKVWAADLVEEKINHQRFCASASHATTIPRAAFMSWRDMTAQIIGTASAFGFHHNAAAQQKIPGELAC